MSRLARIAPPPRLRRLSLACLIDAAGTGMFMTSSVVFFHTRLGLSPRQIGLGLSMALLVGALAPVPVGKAADRWGFRPVLAAASFAAGALFAGYLAVTGFWTFALLAALIAIPTTAQYPLRSGLVSQLSGSDDRVRGVAYIRAVGNTGFALGALLAGLLIAVGGRFAFPTLITTDCLSFLAAGLILLRLPAAAKLGDAPSPDQPPTAEVRRSPYREPRFLAAAVLCAVLVSFDGLMTVGLPLFLVLRHAPASAVPLVMGLNFVLISLLQVKMSSRHSTALAGARVLGRTAVLLAVATGLLMASASLNSGWAIAVALTATALLTFAEMAWTTGSTALFFGLAAPGQQGHYLGVATTVQQVFMVAAPTVMAGAAAAGSTGWGWLTLAYGAAGAAAVTLAARLRRPEQSAVRLDQA